MIINIACNSKSNNYLPLIWTLSYNGIDSIETQYAKKISKLMIYTPASDTSKCDAVLIILNKDEDIAKYWKLRNDSVILQGILNSDSIFLYNNYKKTGAVEAEKYHKNTFIPPILCGLDTENVIYKDNKTIFYFEYGKNIVSHKELPERKKYREEWLEIIRKELKPILGSE